ncbi:DUF1501 domain-containing protein [Aeoliella sp. ICT_H6.2]|uniref:DUF1501 domain-containing protein n=1 Tax=Aeoliella straminimaris TaxID=2954799 RepID=A0A9X2FH05_9BACT|nr:DUF1501 domain-containing protein [Aeoliella straminimaris]MCO6045486.1 DUF1501 domain-containing protein [Aeoliella straminimaris]
MTPVEQYLQHLTRRHFFAQGAMGLGTAALASMGMAPTAQAKSSVGIPSVPHFAPKAKRAIYLFMAGAPSPPDLFDYKPKMVDKLKVDLRGEKYEDGSPVLRTRVTTMTSGQSAFPIAPTRYKFAQHGKSGAWVSELLPYTAKMVDDISIIRSMWTEAINHDPAITYINTGNQLPGYPSLGAWLSYGLGSENADLPSFVVMTPSWTGRQEAQALYNRLWGTGFLPSKHQGVALRSAGDPVLFLSNPPGVDASDRRRVLDSIAAFNQDHYEQYADPETSARIAQYEMAYRMQTSVPELTDISDEPDHVLDMYGPDVQKPGTFAASCLLARRMVERGVRFTQIFHRGWDQHFNIPVDLPNQCRDVDQPSWALVQDLKNRGLLDDTLVIWGGEFGRTIYCQGALTDKTYGRDHHPGCFTVWMAGGGVKGGVVHGTTDDYGCNIVDASGAPTDKFEDGAVHIRDLNATILHQLGIDHEKLSIKFRGLDQRLTGVEEARVVTPVLG